MFDSESMIFNLPFFGLTYTSHEGWGEQALRDAGGVGSSACDSAPRPPDLIDAVERDGGVTTPLRASNWKAGGSAIPITRPSRKSDALFNLDVRARLHVS